MKKRILLIGAVILTIGIVSRTYERIDIPRQCALNNISYETVSYIKQFTPYSKYTIMISLKRGRDNGDDLWTVLGNLDPQLTPKEVNKIISTIEEDKNELYY